MVGGRVQPGVREQAAAHPPGADACAHAVVDHLHGPLVDHVDGGCAGGDRVRQPRSGIGRAHAGAGDADHRERVDQSQVGVARGHAEAAVAVLRDPVAAHVVRELCPAGVGQRQQAVGVTRADHVERARADRVDSPGPGPLGGRARAPDCRCAGRRGAVRRRASAARTSRARARGRPGTGSRSRPRASSSRPTAPAVRSTSTRISSRSVAAVGACAAAGAATHAGSSAQRVRISFSRIERLNLQRLPDPRSGLRVSGRSGSGAAAARSRRPRRWRTPSRRPRAAG